MGLFSSFKARKAIQALLDSGSAATPEGRQAVQSLKKIGNAVIPQLFGALDEATDTSAIENVLEGMLSNATLPMYIEALGFDERAIVKRVKAILQRVDRYDVNQLIPAFDRAEINKHDLVDILAAQKDRVSQDALLNMLGQVASGVRANIFQVLQQVINESSVPHLIKLSLNDSAEIRYRAVQLMTGFSTAEVRTRLLELLKDVNNNVRKEALEALGQLNIPVPTREICELLRDPDMMVQAAAIETLVRINDANTVRYLIDYLQDESEYVRRAAVEVLNEVGDHRAIKDLLDALRDKDWWVKVRAADALGSIGGPRVVDAVLALIRDEDEFLRRTAVEILNTSKDERAFESLVNALKDEDWWVRERAADALATLGDKRALEPLREMLSQGPEASQVAIRALAALGDKRAIQPIVGALKTNHSGVRREALMALDQLVDEDDAVEIQDAVTQLIHEPDEEIRELANTVVINMAGRFGNDKRRNSSGSGVKQKTPVAMSAALRMEDHESLIIDASKLRPGDRIADRYRVIRKVGKGGFGVVVLVEDEVVDDQFILKFLNPSLATDESVVQRFTHELRYARKVTHENIIRIYDFLTFGKSYAISMEYFESHSLGDELEARKPVKVRRMCGILRDICSGMTAAQQVNVVHRDLKPANILINDQDIVKIVDFGLAAAASQMDNRITKTGILVGTPTYMAPEQARGGEIDSRTDIYSLGVIMYRIFTGKPPYDEKDPMSTLLKHVEGKAIPPREVNSALPQSLENIIIKAMQVNKEDRYQSFSEMRKDLSAVIKELS